MLPPDAAVAPPGQVPPTAGVVATVTLAGKVSVSAAVRVRAAAVVLPRLMVSVEVSPDLMVAGAKDLLTDGPGGAVTVSGEVAGVGLLPPLVCSAPVGMVLTYAPGTVLVTLTMMVQPPTGMDAPKA